MSVPYSTFDLNCVLGTLR